MATEIIRYQLRRGLAAQWADANPVLGPGEPGIETDTKRQKLGDGTSTWLQLPYSSISTAEVQQAVDAGAAAGTSAFNAGQSAAAALGHKNSAEAAAAAAQAVPTTTDGLVKGLLDNPASQTAAALTATYVPGSQETAPTKGDQQQKYLAGTASTIVATGHSLMYGQDTSATGTRPAANGATQTRSSDPIPEMLATTLGYITPGAAKPAVVNQGFPGDRSVEILNRWAGGTSGDIELIWADTNDGKNYGNYADGTLTASASVANLKALIKRAISRGAQPVVLGNMHVYDNVASGLIFAISEAQHQLCDRMGVPWVDVSELVRVLGTGQVWTDNVHLKPAAYAAIGARLAGFFGQRGFHPQKVRPGTVIYPKHNTHAPGNVWNYTRSTASDGFTLELQPGGLLSFPVEVMEPCEVIVKFHTETGVGVGAARIYYASDKAGIGYQAMSIPEAMSKSSSMRGHKLSPGVDVIVLSNLSGVLEIDSVHFVPVRESMRPSTLLGATTKQRRSDLAGSVLFGGGTIFQGTYDGRCDEYTPVHIHTGTGYSAARIDWGVNFTIPAAGKVSGPAAHASVDTVKDTLMGAGYFFACDSAGQLIIREITPTGATDLQTIAGVFGSGKFSGTVSLAVTAAGVAQVYVDGVAKGTTWTPRWHAFMPGAIAQSPMVVTGCTVTGRYV